MSYGVVEEAVAHGPPCSTSSRSDSFDAAERRSQSTLFPLVGGH